VNRGGGKKDKGKRGGRGWCERGVLVREESELPLPGTVRKRVVRAGREMEG
jgi:hypothetical protein